MMFSAGVNKPLLIATVLALLASAVSAGIKADCWAGTDCTGVLNRSNGCTLPPSSEYDFSSDPPLDPLRYNAENWMGVPMDFCGNRKSLLPGTEGRLQALQYCFEIGANSACIWGECDQPDSCVSTPPDTWGDPHFRTWSNENYDYHGVCDLVFLESKSHNMTVHIRTTQKFHYSYVSSAAIELNGERMEFGSWGSVIHNGMFESDDHELPKTFGGNDLYLEVSNRKAHTYMITLGDGFGVEVKTFKDMVGVKVIGSRGAFADSRGLMGSAVTGQRVGRDGKTILEDSNAFGQEWQVLETEPKLFETNREPQAPATCFIPSDPETTGRRRLGEMMARQEAEDACKNWHMNKEACIMDVIATGDKDLAANIY